MTAKADLLKEFHSKLDGPVAKISLQQIAREDKAKAVNQLVSETATQIFKSIKVQPDKQQVTGVILQYCYSVVSLEYRHRVWPYEYMAFSRRVGELWEQFCKAAWDFPGRSGVIRISPPKFSDVQSVLLKRIKDNLGVHNNRDEILTDVNILFDIIGEINMVEDEVFTVDGVPYVIDFKSGFGSNEKGNMLRLKTVGEAYRVWNQKTNLMLLVRQDVNNNYLNVLRRAGLWSVHTGNDAYRQISTLTGIDMQSIRDNVVDWSNDLSADFMNYLRSQGKDLTGYLAW